MYVMQSLHKLNPWIVTAANESSLSCWKVQPFDRCFSQQSPSGETNLYINYCVRFENLYLAHEVKFKRSWQGKVSLPVLNILFALIHSFIHSFHWHMQNAMIPCCSQELLPSSLLRTFSCHSSPPTILPSSLTSSRHLFLGLPLNLVVPKFIYNTFREVYFLPFSVHAQTNVIYLILLSLSIR